MRVIAMRRGCCWVQLALQHLRLCHNALLLQEDSGRAGAGERGRSERRGGAHTKPRGGGRNAAPQSTSPRTSASRVRHSM